MFSGCCRKFPRISHRRRLRFSPCNMTKSWKIDGFLIGKSIILSNSCYVRLRSLLWNRPKQRQVLQKASAVGADLISLRFRRLSLTIDNHEKCPKWVKTHLCKWSKSLPGSLLCIDLKHAYLKHTWRIFDACLPHVLIKRRVLFASRINHKIAPHNRLIQRSTMSRHLSHRGVFWIKKLEVKSFFIWDLSEKARFERQCFGSQSVRPLT